MQSIRSATNRRPLSWTFRLAVGLATVLAAGVTAPAALAMTWPVVGY